MPHGETRHTYAAFLGLISFAEIWKSGKGLERYGLPMGLFILVAGSLFGTFHWVVDYFIGFLKGIGAVLMAAGFFFIMRAFWAKRKSANK